MIINFKFVRPLRLSAAITLLGKPTIQKRVIDFAIYLSLGTIFFSLTTAFLEVKIDNLRENLSNRQSNIFLLRTVRANTNLDFSFKFTYLQNQDDYYGKYSFGSLFAQWENELKSQKRNNFFASSRLNQANQMLIKLDLLKDHQVAETKNVIAIYNDYKKQSELLTDEFISNFSNQKTQEFDLDKIGLGSAHNREAFEKWVEYFNFTHKNLSKALNGEIIRSKEQKNQIELLNWWSSNTFLIGFLAQIIIYLTFQLFELSLERRKINE